jgi:dTMP kinase
VGRGRYIALEGGEGSGKSTQAARLAEAVGASLTHEPGGTRIGALVRAIVLDPAHTDLVDRAEALLYAADRAQHTAEVVRPALAVGRHVVSDRSAWSSIVYQGHGREMGLDEVRRLSDWATQGCWPDLVVLLDLDPAVAGRRLTGRLDRLELAGAGFHERVRTGFLDLAAADPKGWAVVDGGAEPDAVATAIRVVVRERLGL